jgi:hypothetical protein
MIVIHDLDKLVEHVKAHGGATVRVSDVIYIVQSQDVSSDTFAVSLPGYEVSIDVSALTADVMKAYIETVKHELTQDETCLGIWVDSGKVYLDVSMLVPYRVAIRLARAGNQKAIYDFANNEVLFLGKN